MAAVDNSSLINQICAVSGLQGAELEALQRQLAEMNEQQLQARLAQALAGEEQGVGDTFVRSDGARNEQAVTQGLTQRTYTQNNDEVTETRRNDVLVEKKIVHVEDNAVVIVTVISYAEDGQTPKTKKTTKKDGDKETVSTTTYEHSENEAGIEIVTATTTDEEGRQIEETALAVDRDGNIKDEDFIERVIREPNGDVKTQVLASGADLREQLDALDLTDDVNPDVTADKNYVIESVVKADGTQVFNIYNANSMGEFGEKTGKLYQQTSDGQRAKYDGHGHTYTTVNAGYGWNDMAKLFNQNGNAVRRLNRGGAFPQVHQTILVDGEQDANSPGMRRRVSAEQDDQRYTQQALDVAVQRINYASVTYEVTLDKATTAWDYAITSLKNQGIENPTRQQIQERMMEVKALNNNKDSFKQGEKITDVKGQSSPVQIRNLESIGFQQTRENFIFFQRFNGLDDTQKRNVLSMVRYYQTQKITDTNKFKKDVMAQFGINLFDSGKSVNYNNTLNQNAGLVLQNNQQNPYLSNQTDPNFGKPISIETMITDVLKLDLNSDNGRMIYERLNGCTQEQLDALSYSALRDASNDSFTGIIDMVANAGLNLRTRSEQQQHNQQLEEERIERWQVRMIAAENIGLAYDQAIEIIREYQDNQGVLNVGFWRELAGKGLSLINPTNINTCFADVIEKLEAEKAEVTERLRNAKSESEFDRIFTEYTGKFYSPESMKRFVDVAQIEGADWSSVYNTAFGTSVVESAMSRVSYQSKVDGAGDIATMLLGSGAIAKGITAGFTKAVGKKVMQRIASSKALRVAYAAGNGAATMSTWTGGTGIVNMATNNRTETSEDYAQLWKATYQSAGIGAFGGVLTETVVAPVVRFIEQPTARATQAVTQTMSKGGEFTGKQILDIAAKSGDFKLSGIFTMSQTELQTLARQVVAQGTGLGIEVTGFAGYEALVNGSGDKSFGEEWLAQLETLGEIKGIGRLLMMRKAGRAAQESMIAESEILNNSKFRTIEVKGKPSVEITFPDGNKKVVPQEQVVAVCEQIFQFEMLAKAAAEEASRQDVVNTPVLDRATSNGRSLDHSVKLDAQGEADVRAELQRFLESENLTPRELLEKRQKLSCLSRELSNELTNLIDKKAEQLSPSDKETYFSTINPSGERVISRELFQHLRETEGAELIPTNGIVIRRNPQTGRVIVLGKLQTTANPTTTARPLITPESPRAQQELAQGIISGEQSSVDQALREFDFNKFGKDGLTLKYSRSQFNARIQELLSSLRSVDEQRQLMEHFGLEFGKDGFDGLLNNREFLDETASPEMRTVAGQMRAEIENFTLKNEVQTGNPEIDNLFTTLVQGLPEFASIIGKQQHGTHIYSLDIHTLKVLQEVVKNPAYEGLSPEAKTVAKMTALLHDLGKRGGITDSGHASTSTDFTSVILSKFDLSNEAKGRIMNLIQNHHWFEKYNKGQMSVDELLEIFGTGEDLQIAQMMARADFVSIRPDFHLRFLEGGRKLTQSQFDAKFDSKMDDITRAAREQDKNVSTEFSFERISNEVEALLQKPDVTPAELADAKKKVSFITDGKTKKALNDKIDEKVKNLSPAQNAEYNAIRNQDHFEEKSEQYYNSMYNRVQDREIFYVLDSVVKQRLNGLPEAYKSALLSDAVVNQIQNIRIEGLDGMTWSEKRAVCEQKVNEIMNSPEVKAEIQARADFLKHVEEQIQKEASLTNSKDKTYTNLFRYGEANTGNGWCDANNALRNLLDNIVSRKNGNGVRPATADVIKFIDDNKGVLTTAQQMVHFYDKPEDLELAKQLNTCLDGDVSSFSADFKAELPADIQFVADLPKEVRGILAGQAGKLIMNKGDLLQNLKSLQQYMTDGKLSDGRDFDVKAFLKNLKNVKNYEFIQILGQSKVDGFFDNAVDMLSKVKFRADQKNYGRATWEIAKDSRLYENAQKLLAKGDNLQNTHLKLASALFDVEYFERGKNDLGVKEITDENIDAVCMQSDAQYIREQRANMTEIQVTRLLKDFLQKYNYPLVDGNVSEPHLQVIADTLGIDVGRLKTSEARAELFAEINVKIEDYMNNQEPATGERLTNAVNASDAATVTEMLRSRGIEVDGPALQRILNNPALSGAEKLEQALASAVSNESDAATAYIELRHMGIPEASANKVFTLSLEKQALTEWQKGQNPMDPTHVSNATQQLVVLGVLDGGFGKTVAELKAMPDADLYKVITEHVSKLSNLSGVDCPDVIARNCFSFAKELLANQEALPTTDISELPELRNENGVQILDGHKFSGFFHGIGLLDAADISKVAGARSLTGSATDRTTLSTSYLAEGHYDVCGRTGVIVEGSLIAMNPFDSQFFTRVSTKDATQYFFNNGTNTLNGLTSSYRLRSNFSDLITRVAEEHNCSREQAQGLILGRSTFGQEISRPDIDGIYNTGVSGTYNEGLLYNPQSKALSYVGRPGDPIPTELLNLAQKCRLPIVLIPAK